MMNRQFPGELDSVLLDIIQAGVFSVRAFSWAGDSDRAACEADHIHTLPSIIKSGSLEQLRYYMAAKVPAYVDAVGEEGADTIKTAWDEIRRVLDALE